MRARNMRALAEDTQARCPGVVVYGVGDDSHRLHTSDHNEDDTPGSKAAQSDADSVPEHRAIDVMLGPAFSRAQAEAYVQDLLDDPAARERLFYIIFYRRIWSRSAGWLERDYEEDDPHTDHVHVSGWAADDENGAGWPAVWEGSQVYCRAGDTGSLNVETLQRRMVRLGGKKANGKPFTLADVDRAYGADTTAALKSVIGGAGTYFGPAEVEALEFVYAVRFGAGPGPAGPEGPQGDPGPAGQDGKDAVLEVGTRLAVLPD